MNFKQGIDLTKFYLKNIFLMKLAGRIYGLFSPDTTQSWDALHQSFAGQDTWLVVGNGPSLNVADLESLAAIPAIASNKINLLFSKTAWRPTLYTAADPLLLHKLPADHFDDVPQTLLPHTHVFMAKTSRLLPWWHISDETGAEMYVHGGALPSPTKGLFVGRTITCPNLELAMWAGAKTIYLIGCDHNYTKEDTLKGGRHATHKNGSDHFDPNYRKPGEMVNIAPIDLMNAAYEMVRKIADKQEIRIVNITRRTSLTAFEIGTIEDAVDAIRAKE